jgi:hypothetical protein
MSWFSKFWRKLVQRANAVWRDNVAPAVKDSWELFSNEFEQLAFDTVTRLAVTTLTGDQKFKDAVKIVLEDAKSKGWAIGTSAVQLLVQRAYVNYKAAGGDLTLSAPK